MFLYQSQSTNLCAKIFGSSNYLILGKIKSICKSYIPKIRRNNRELLGLDMYRMGVDVRLGDLGCLESSLT